MIDAAHLTAIALNFEGANAPDWVQLTPRGPDITGRDGRRWRLDDPQRVVDAFRANGADLPVDIEHATQLKGVNGDPAPAVGWIEEIEARNGELWGRVSWTEDGRAAVAGRAYRYLSPVFSFIKQTGAVTRMSSAGLTNKPNFELGALNSQTPDQERDMDAAVLEALGLNRDASAADAVVAITNLKKAEAEALNRAATPDPEKFVPRADHDLALNRVREFEAGEKSREEEAINRAVDAGIEAGKLSPASRDFHVATATANGLDKFTAMLGGLPVIGAKSGLDARKPDSQATALNSEEQVIADQMGLTAEDFLDAKKKEA